MGNNPKVVKTVVEGILTDSPPKKRERRGEHKKRITLFLDPEIAKRLRVLAAVEGKSMSEIVEQLIRNAS